MENGLWALLDAAVTNKVSGRQFSTYQPVDDLCNFFVIFFLPVVDGNHPGLSLLSFVFAGQWLAGWAIILMESHRAGNQGKWIL